eukprot:284340-Amphidinium_carterae.2
MAAVGAKKVLKGNLHNLMPEGVQLQESTSVLNILDSFRESNKEEGRAKGNLCSVLGNRVCGIPCHRCTVTCTTPLPVSAGAASDDGPVMARA